MKTSTNCACQAQTDEKELLARIAELAKENSKDALIQVLHMAQAVFGYLPLEVQQLVADTMEIPLSEVSGVVSFYSFFAEQPRGKHTIRVCLGTACYVRGGKKIVERLSEMLGVKVGETTKDRNYTLEGRGMNITMNGKPLTVPDGATIIEAATMCNIKIPSLC